MLLEPGIPYAKHVLGPWFITIFLMLAIMNHNSLTANALGMCNIIMILKKCKCNCWVTVPLVGMYNS